MRVSLFVSAVLLAALGAGCSFLGSNSSDTRAAPPSDVVQLLTDSVDVGTLVGDAYWIEEAGIEGDSLRLRVSHSGGCRTHTFALYSTGPVYFSDPPQADVFLAHDADGDLCEALIGEDLAFDLTPLRNQANGEAMDLRLHDHDASAPVELLRFQ
ncbi:MAG: hypothetical protein AAGI71_00060 [Bacteroidota bacterium]